MVCFNCDSWIANMKKYDKINTLKIHIYWTTYLQSIIKSLNHEYYFYKTGTISSLKLADVMLKLDDLYKLTDSIVERFERYQNGFSTVVIHMLRIDQEIKFILMCRANATKTGIFFEREKYADARSHKNRISLNDCYEVIRINKEVYNIDTKQTNTHNGVWTVGLTIKEQQQIYELFNTALFQRNYKIIKQVCYGLHHLIGFATVRQQYLELKLKLEKRFAKFMGSQQWSQYKILADLYKLPTKIGYVKKVAVEYVSVENFIKLKNVK